MTLEDEVSMIIDYLKDNDIIRKDFLTRATGVAL